MNKTCTGADLLPVSDGLFEQARAAGIRFIAAASLGTIHGLIGLPEETGQSARIFRVKRQADTRGTLQRLGTDHIGLFERSGQTKREFVSHFS